jgi:nucleotide-binding universal stress UspA family protein
MPRLNKILVPVDFSDCARDAARYAAALAGHFGAEVSLLHVIPPFHFGFSMAELPGPRHEHVEARNRSVWKALENFPEPVSNSEMLRRELREGDAAEEIISRAHEGRFDAIVMPTRGANALRRLLLMGSVTAKVLSAVECPVVTGINLRTQGDRLQIRNIVCAIDLGDATERVLCWGSELASLFGARLRVVHAAPGAGEAAADYFDETWRVTLVDRLRERIDVILRNANQQADVTVVAGAPPRVVTSVAHDTGADLLLIGRGTSNDFLGRLRANAYDIIRQSQCPVMSV